MITINFTWINSDWSDCYCLTIISNTIAVVIDSIGAVGAVVDIIAVTIGVIDGTRIIGMLL